MTSSTSSLRQRGPAKARTEATNASEDEEGSSANMKNPTVTKPKVRPFRLIDLLEGIGGTVHFSFFKAPLWVDLSLPPGTTSQEKMYLENPKLWSLLTGQYLLFSPNLIWITITAAIYLLAPYDMEAAKQDGWKLQWFLNRALLNVSVMLTYYGFWHGVLYGLGWASRPFAQGRVYRWSKLFHNVWYCTLGTIQWTAWEMVMVHLYATGRIGYQADEEILASWKGMANFVACCVIVPLFREFHFFASHRLIHFRCLYKYIHALHHRNTDVDPFAGICMSPAEHLYYISSIAPSVYWHASPFQFLWNGINLILSPGGSHSGWEDHCQSDQFHAAHHRYFECNYGTPAMPFDRWCGTFRETMAPQTKAYHGEAVECASVTGSDIITARADAKSTLWGLPSWDQMLYMVATSLGLPLFVIAATVHRDSAGEEKSSLSFFYQAPVAALIVSIGPLVLAVLLAAITANPPINSWARFRYTMLYPFHKESLFGQFGIVAGMGFLLSIMPTYHFFHSLFVQNPQDTIYNRIWETAT